VLASIFELMQGPRNAMPQNVPRVKSLVATLNRKYGPNGRFLWRAWDQQGDSLHGEVVQEVDAIEREYSRRLAAGG
jgi:hypothetical protein